MREDRLKERRKAKGLKMEDVAEALGVTKATVSRWESGERSPSLDKLIPLSDILDTSIGYLLGQTDIPQRGELEAAMARISRESQNIPIPTLVEETELHVSESNVVPANTHPDGWRRIPLYSRMRSACGGSGNGLEVADFEIESMQYFPAEIYGKWDDEKPPFMKYVEGDSMEPAGIFDGAAVLVNPAEPVSDGESALVCWGDDVQAVKLVYWLPDGVVEFHAANPDHPKVYRFTLKDFDTGRAGIIGKIMWSGQKPKRMK